MAYKKAEVWGIAVRFIKLSENRGIILVQQN
jgi:hypothetical protein